MQCHIEPRDRLYVPLHIGLPVGGRRPGLALGGPVQVAWWNCPTPGLLVCLQPAGRDATRDGPGWRLCSTQVHGVASCRRADQVCLVLQVEDKEPVNNVDTSSSDFTILQVNGFVS